MEEIRDFIAKYGDISKLDGNKYNGSLYLQGTQITSLPSGLVVGGWLDLEGTQITSLPSGLVVGGSLNLEGTQITSLPSGLVVGGSLYLQGTQITSLPSGLVVGGWLDLEGTQITDTSMVKRDVPQLLRWEYKGREYIKVDGIFSRVLSHKGKVWRIQQIGSKEVQYLVTDGEGRYSHGDTLQQAKADLVYKISERNTDKYKDMTLDTRLTFAEAVECYRVITGACEAGTRGFVQSLGESVKKHYTIVEMIEVTKGQYGNDTFREFFRK